MVDLEALKAEINAAGIPETWARVQPNGPDHWWLSVYGGPNVTRIAVDDTGGVGMHTGAVNWPALRLIDRYLHAVGVISCDSIVRGDEEVAA